MVTGVIVPDTQAWPPSTTLHPGDVARLVSIRLDGLGIEGIRTIGAAVVEGHWLDRKSVV